MTMTGKKTHRGRFAPIQVVAGLLFTLLACSGCPPHEKPIPFDPVPIDEALALVNANSSELQLTVRAKAGSATGVFVEPDGTKHRFDVDAALLVHPPRCMRMDMSVLGNSQFVFGSNNERYWAEQVSANALSWGRHDQQVNPAAEDMIIRPDLIVEALGINPLPPTTHVLFGPFQRITNDCQELHFVDYDEKLRGFISKEYWLSRYEPRMVERIVFRDAMGEKIMESHLSRYKPVKSDGPLMPHKVYISWPVTGSELTFTAAGWKLLPKVNENHPAFTFPIDLGKSFDRIVDIDVKLEAIHDQSDIRGNSTGNADFSIVIIHIIAGWAPGGVMLDRSPRAFIMPL